MSIQSAIAMWDGRPQATGLVPELPLHRDGVGAQTRPELDAEDRGVLSSMMLELRFERWLEQAGLS